MPLEMTRGLAYMNAFAEAEIIHFTRECSSLGAGFPDRRRVSSLNARVGSSHSPGDIHSGVSSV
jgi:hypothetical protein